MLTKYLELAAADLRRTKPTQADQRRNPDIDVMQVWLSDIEHTVRCQELTGEMADEFRRAVGP